MIEDLLNEQQVSAALQSCEEQTLFVFGPLGILVKSNSASLLHELATYYKGYSTERSASSQLTLYMIEQPAVGEELTWLEVPREAGKQGRKEGYLDAPAGRWIKKFKTDMSFLQRVDNPVAVGPCLAHIAQVINFINNQYLNHFLQQGFMLGHAAAFDRGGKVTAIAAGSGGGKSTLMLRCLEHPERRFLTNDRLLFAQQAHGPQALGLAKLPRVNPGTLLHSPRLRHILSAQRQQELERMPAAELWPLEEKYDVHVDDEYGADRLTLKGRFANLVMLDWSHSSEQPTALERIDLSVQPTMIEGLRKRPGPFYQDARGEFSADLNQIASFDDYVRQLEGVSVFRFTGQVDFEAAFQLMSDL